MTDLRGDPGGVVHLALLLEGELGVRHVHPRHQLVVRDTVNLEGGRRRRGRRRRTRRRKEEENINRQRYG